jgi:hypothetical protein
MRVIFYLILSILSLFFCDILRASELREDDFRAGQDFGYTRSDIREAYKQAKKNNQIDKITKQVASNLEFDRISAAKNIDQAIFNLIDLTIEVLNVKGHYKLAGEIETEYLVYYQDSVLRQVFGEKEMGDHAPLSDWLVGVHKKTHEALGDFLCQYFRFHDIFIINFGVPVVLNPKLYDLKDYKDHFAGHLIWGVFWEHHGVAGVVTYWLINGVCIGATYGLGVLPFVCSPIASLGENVMDKRIAPPIAERVWQRAQENL